MTTTNTAPASQPSAEGRVTEAKPVIADKRPSSEAALVYVFVLFPTLALIAAVPLAWGWGLSWLDVGLAVGFYFLSGFGVTVGFHRYFTHRAFKANRRPAQRARDRRAASPCRVTSSPGWPTTVATTPSPTRKATRTRRGCSAPPQLALARGFFHSHLGWMFNRDRTNVSPVRPRPARRPRHRPDRQAVPALDRCHVCWRRP